MTENRYKPGASIILYNHYLEVFGDSFIIFETPVGAADWSDLLPFRNGRYQMFVARFYLHSQVRKIDTCRRIDYTHKVTLRIAYCACLPGECDILGCSYLNKIAC